MVVARCGADGNEVGSLLPPEVAIPLATYTGWSLRQRDPGPHNELVGLNGSYIPFAVSRKERESTGDPRESLQERYGSLERYLEDLDAACLEMVEQGYLLEEDRQRVLARQKERAAPQFEQIQ